MKKRLKVWGKGMGIYFSKEEIAIYGLKENDVIEIDEMLWEGKVK